MGRDLTVCRHCKQTEPTAIILLIKGKPSGICKSCKHNEDLRRRVQAKASQGLYNSKPALVEANLKILSGLCNGTYTLIKNTDKAQAGYIIVQFESIYVNVYNRSDLFHYELFGIASYLGDLNTLIAPSERLKASAINPEALAGIQASSVQDRLIWYDRALVAKAVKLLKAEAKEIRQANMAIARAARRSTNPK